jgi:vitamin B12 transporter
VDGVPVNAPGGFVDLADLSVTNVERIEVVRGPTSVLYGSDAVTGVVQVFTRRGAGPPTLTATALPGVGTRRSGDGSYPMLELEAAMSGGSDRVSYSLGASRFATNGLLPLNNGYEDRVLSGRIALAPHSGTDIAVTARLNDGRYHYPTDGAGQIVDANAVQDAGTRTLAVDAGQRLGRRMRLHLQLAESATRRTFDDAPDGPADTLGTFAGTGHQRLTRRSADARLDVLLGSATLSMGATAETGAVDGATEYVSAFGPFTGSTDERRTTIGAYAQLVARLDALAVQAGLRREDARTFGVFDTWRLAASYALPAGVRLRASFGTAFREPSFAESFGSGFGDVGNPDLTPETARSWDVGLEKEIGRGRVVLTWFDQAFTDLVQYTFATPQPGDPNYDNVGGATARGLELEGRLPLGDAIALDAAASLLRTRVTDQGLATDATFVEGEPLLRRPAVSGDIGVSWAFDAGSIRVAARHTGARDDVDYSAAFPYPRVTLAPVTLLDLAAEYRLPVLAGNATMLLRVANALDAEYQQIAGYPAPGRVVRLGVRVGGR